MGVSWVPPGSAATHCARWPFSAILYSNRQPIPGVLKLPKRWVLGNGYDRGKREDRKRKSAKKSGFGGVMPFCWYSAGGRQVPRWPFVAAGVSPLPYIPPADQYQALRNRRKLCIGEGRMEGENERIESAKTRKIGFLGVTPSCRCSVGFRQFPRPPIVPDGLSPRPYMPTANLYQA